MYIFMYAWMYTYIIDIYIYMYIHVDIRGLEAPPVSLSASVLSISCAPRGLTRGLLRFAAGIHRLKLLSC